VNTIAKWVAVFALLACPMAVDATAVTFDFTGTIITGLAVNDYAGPPTGIYAGDTGTVSGTFAFDFANENPAQSSGTIATTTGWSVENWTGTNQSGPQTAPGNVFSTTLVGTGAGDVGLSYSTAVPPPFWGISGVQADLSFDEQYFGSPQYIAQEGNYPTSVSGTQSAFLITGPILGYQGPVGFSSSGLPVFVSGLTYTGFVAMAGNGTSNGVYFDITSLTPATTVAPEIDPGTAESGLTLLAGLAALVGGRRRAAA
jgi:hypothetical protein